MPHKCTLCKIRFFTPEDLEAHNNRECHVSDHCQYKDLRDLIALCADLERILALEEFAMEIAPSINHTVIAHGIPGLFYGKTKRLKMMRVIAYATIQSGSTPTPFSTYVPSTS